MGGTIRGGRRALALLALLAALLTTLLPHGARPVAASAGCSGGGIDGKRGNGDAEALA